MIPDFAAFNPGYRLLCPSPLLAGEVLQVRRRLVLTGRHQLAVGAEEVVLVLDLDPRVLLCAHRRTPEWPRVRRALRLLGDRPGSRQRIVEDRDLVIEDVLV